VCHHKPSASSRILYCGHSTQYSHLVVCLTADELSAMVDRGLFVGFSLNCITPEVIVGC